MNVETEICRALSRLLKERLNDFEITGNWLPDDDLKGVDAYEGRKLEIRVSARKYDGFTSHVAEFSVSLDGSLALEEDESFAATVAAYEKVASLLDEWQGSIASAKRDLTVAGVFDPVGFRLDGGSGVDVDEESKRRTFGQQFTVRGRLLRNRA